MFVTMYQSYAFANKTSHAQYHGGLLIIRLTSMIIPLLTPKNWLSRFTYSHEFLLGHAYPWGKQYDRWHKAWGGIPLLFLWRHWKVGWQQQQGFKKCNKHGQEMYCWTGLVHKRFFPIFPKVFCRKCCHILYCFHFLHLVQAQLCSNSWCFHFFHLVQAKLRWNWWYFHFLKQFLLFSKQHNENLGFLQNVLALFETMVMNFQVWISQVRLVQVLKQLQFKVEHVRNCIQCNFITVCPTSCHFCYILAPWNTCRKLQGNFIWRIIMRVKVTDDLIS